MTLLEFLKELDNLIEGCERAVYKEDDPSGDYTDYVLDTEAFRKKLQERILEVENDNGNSSNDNN